MTTATPIDRDFEEMLQSSLNWDPANEPTTGGSRSGPGLPPPPTQPPVPPDPPRTPRGSLRGARRRGEEEEERESPAPEFVKVESDVKLVLKDVPEAIEEYRRWRYYTTASIVAASPDPVKAMPWVL